jgi:hypothetical protein
LELNYILKLMTQKTKTWQSGYLKDEKKTWQYQQWDNSKETKKSIYIIYILLNKLKPYKLIKYDGICPIYILIIFTFKVSWNSKNYIPGFATKM